MRTAQLRDHHAADAELRGSPTLAMTARSDRGCLAPPFVITHLGEGLEVRAPLQPGGQASAGRFEDAGLVRGFNNAVADNRLDDLHPGLGALVRQERAFPIPLLALAFRRAI